MNISSTTSMFIKFFRVFPLIFFFFLLITEFAEIESRRQRQQQQQAGDGSRAIGYKKGKKKGPTKVYKWRPSEDTKLALAKQKGISEDEISENDPEFKFLWADDYYDDYDFEHSRNMIQHGTWEAKRQNYYEAELKAAREALRKEKEGDTDGGGGDAVA